MKRKKTGGRDFPPGVSGNYKGRPKVPEDLKTARWLNKIELERILNEYAYLPRPELEERLTLPSTPPIELAVGRLWIETIDRGDERRLGFIIDRLVGPVKAKISLDGGEDGQPINISHLTQLTDEQLNARIEELKKKLGHV